MAHRPVSAFVQSISDLSVDRVSHRDVVFAAPVDWSVELSHVVADPPMEADLTLTRTRGGCLVRGVVTVDVIHTCARCLTERSETVTVEVAELIADAIDPEDEDPPDYLIEHETVDLEPVLRDATLLAMPLRPVCQETCAELVVADETGLNAVDSGDETPVSSPFAVLRDLIEHAD